MSGATVDREDGIEEQNNKPSHTAPNQGERFLLVGAELITFKLRGEDYSIFENATQGGYGGPPPHRHLHQDEGFYVLEGEFTGPGGGVRHLTPSGVASYQNMG